MFVAALAFGTRSEKKTTINKLKCYCDACIKNASKNYFQGPLQNIKNYFAHVKKCCLRSIFDFRYKKTHSQTFFASLSRDQPKRFAFIQFLLGTISIRWNVTGIHKHGVVAVTAENSQSARVIQ